MTEPTRRGIESLLELMRTLRDPERGCPWDRRQSFQTIAPYTIEEAYEVADAILRGDLQDLREELGDLLFQVVFHAQMASEAGQFDFDDVVGAIVAKMVRRHPHVFAEAPAGDLPRAWESMKAAERRGKADPGEEPSALDGVPVTMPALARAGKLQRRARSVGFDWAGVGGVIEKLREEMAELEAELDRDRHSARAGQELGDVLFTCVNLARHQGVDPERMLREANARFEARFRHMEAQASREGVALSERNSEDLEALWARAKSFEVDSADVSADASVDSPADPSVDTAAHE